MRMATDVAKALELAQHGPGRKHDRVMALTRW